MPTKNDEISTSNNMGIKKTHWKYHEGHTIWIGKFSFWAKWSTKYDVGGHHACQEICRTQKDIKNGKGAKQVVEGQLEVLARKVNV